eukprot:c9012_g1_i1.p1 GENE.c9012_g1_i1~~c9012_g1_i1.p1  ORF type:complete len:119 (+),score=5.55 c9012_g1_i1:395-751(+)
MHTVVRPLTYLLGSPCAQDRELISSNSETSMGTTNNLIIESCSDSIIIILSRIGSAMQRESGREMYFSWFDASSHDFLCSPFAATSSASIINVSFFILSYLQAICVCVAFLTGGVLFM